MKKSIKAGSVRVTKKDHKNIGIWLMMLQSHLTMAGWDNCDVENIAYLRKLWAEGFEEGV